MYVWLGKKFTYLFENNSNSLSRLLQNNIVNILHVECFQEKIKNIFWNSFAHQNCHKITFIHKHNRQIQYIHYIYVHIT
jgi:hypothetical protein